MLEWLQQHWPELTAAFAALSTFASIVVRLTPTPRDDEVLKRILDWASFLRPKDAPGTLKMPLLQHTKPKKHLPKYQTPWRK